MGLYIVYNPTNNKQKGKKNAILNTKRNTIRIDLDNSFDIIEQQITDINKANDRLQGYNLIDEDKDSCLFYFKI